MTTKLLFDGKRAIGVEYVENGVTKQAYSSNDIILSGGAINSPQLLMLSGIGDKATLQIHTMQKSSELEILDAVKNN